MSGGDRLPVLLALRLQVPGLPATTRERTWSYPIWYSPMRLDQSGMGDG